ncbi:unnamed protein product [Parajaminaea phylloscopi]
MSSNSGSNNEEQSFTIQPHPATTNDPANDPALQGNSGSGAAVDPHGKPGPFIADASKLGDAKSKDELRAASAKLNQD